MTPFFVLLFVPIMIQHIQIGNKNINYEKRNRIALIFFFAFLTVLVMLRHESIGNDTKNYIQYFHQVSKMNWHQVRISSEEFGFSYLNKVISLFSQNQHFYLAVVSIITFSMIYPTYKRVCSDASLTIVLFCTMSTFVMLFSGIRQMLAIGIGFIAYEFTRNKKTIPFIICVILAMLFHISAFILAFIYPIYHTTIKRKNLFVIIPILVGTFIFNKQIFSFLTSVLARFTRFDGQMTSTGAFTMLLLFIIFVAFSFLVVDESILDKETIGLRNLLLFALVLQMFAPLHMLAMRLNYYYLIFIPLLMPKIVACRRQQWNQVAIAGRYVMFVFFLLYFFYSAYTKENNLHVFPYHFFWENV